MRGGPWAADLCRNLVPAGLAVVVRVAGQLALQASRGGFLGRLLEAAACEALLTALLVRLLETGASLALLAARVHCDRVCVCLQL